MNINDISKGNHRSRNAQISRVSLKSQARAPAYSRALRQIKGVVKMYM